MQQSGPFSERTERLILAIIGVDLLLQGAETLPALTDFARFFRWAGMGVWLVRMPPDVRGLQSEQAVAEADVALAHRNRSTALVRM